MRLPLILVATTALAACSQTHHSHSEHHHHAADASEFSALGAVTPWTHLKFANDPEAFQFAIVTDRTGGMRPGVFSEAVDKLNLLQPEFVVSVGDLIEGYTEDRGQLVSEWNEFDAMVARLDMPFFYLAGNHDYTNPVMAEIWKERYGDSYYHFTYRDTLFVMLNSNDGGETHTFSEEQVSWLQRTLTENPEPRWTLIFTHSPLWDRENQDRWGEIEALLQDRQYTVFAGHHHRYVKDQRHGQKYFTLATTGGVSSMRGSRFGEFDHVVWVTMSDDGPIIANLMLDGILDENVRTAEMRDLQNTMIDRGRLSAPALLHRGYFTSGTAELRLTNDADIPYTLNARLNPRAGFAVTGESPRSVTVPPNEVRTLPIEIKSLEPVTGDQNAIDIEWELRYQYNDKPVHYEGSRTVAISRERPIKHLEDIELDGRLDEWQAAEFFSTADNQYFQSENWSGLKDADFSWSVAEGERHVVLALEVTDDAIVRTESDNVWAGDAMLLTLDARPRTRRLLKKTYNNSVPGQRYMILQPPADGLASDLKGNPKVPDLIQYQVHVTETGYTAEIAIPHELLSEDHGSRWDGLRLNVLLRDVDPDEPGMVGREWLSSWDYDGSIAGAGSFYRQ